MYYMLKKRVIVEAIQQEFSSDDYKVKLVEANDMIGSMNDMIELVIRTMKENNETKARFGNLIIEIKQSKSREYINPKTKEVSVIEGEEKVKISYSPEKTSMTERKKNKEDNE